MKLAISHILLEALQKMADGKATKLIIPSDLQGIAGLTAAIKNIAVKDEGAAE